MSLNQVFCFVGSSQKVDWLESGKDISPSTASTSMSTKTGKEAKGIDLLHSSIMPNQTHQVEELLDIGDDEDLGGGLMDRPSTSNGRISTPVQGQPISLEDATALKEIILGMKFQHTVLEGSISVQKVMIGLLINLTFWTQNSNVEWCVSRKDEENLI